MLLPELRWKVFFGQNLSPLEHRCAEILYYQFQHFHQNPKGHSIYQKIQDLEVKLGKILNTHRSLHKGHPVSASELALLAQDPDTTVRREAYFCRNQVNKKLVEGGFIELLHWRNEYAQSCQTLHFVEFSLKQQQLPPNLFTQWPQLCKSYSSLFQTKMNTLAQTHLATETYNPWDKVLLSKKVAPIDQEPIELIGFQKVLSRAFSDFGFSIGNLNITYDIFPRQNK